MKIKTAVAARLLGKLSQWRSRLAPIGDMTEAQIKKLAMRGAYAASIMGLAVVLVISGNSMVIPETMDTSDVPTTYESVYGAYYDVSNVDPGKVCTINVNGQKIVYMADAQAAQAVLDGIIAKYVWAGTQLNSATFSEDIKIEPATDYVTAEMAAKDKTVSETYICNVDEAINFLLTGCAEYKSYVVKGGDTMWDIAKASGMSIDSIIALNPGLNADRLTIGTVVNLSESRPFVNVSTVEVSTETETIPFTTQYTDSDSLYKGQTKVTSVGVNGSKEKITKYVKQNGVIVSSQTLSETITAQPVMQLAVKGTAAMPVNTGSGTLMSPLGSTQLSSSAGSFGASRGSRRHLGVDLKGNCGDPIVAADAGTVTFAGWSNSYGNLIKISHGNGIETRYAHCNSISVSVGTSVEKGEQIGTVGKTGNATGYLCHFEVRVNGTAVNPLKYI